jgi:predicted phage terminase large subunit-like protein
VYSNFDNPLLKPEDVRELASEIKKMNPAMEQQEIYGQFVDGVGHKLWDNEQIEVSRREKPEQFDRVVVAVDPAGGNGKKNDDTGIIVVGRSNKKAYVLEDRTGKYSPNGWASIVKNLVDKYDADAVIAEKNYGGDMVGTILKNAGITARIKLVTARKGKILRAEPVQAIWEQGGAFLCGYFPELETQMQFYDGSGDSPNNLDAMVYAVTEQVVKAPRQAFGMT